MPHFVLDPALPILVRPDGAVQVGWDPRRAQLVRPPRGLTASALADVLRTIQSGGVDAGELRSLAMNRGARDADAVSALIDSLALARVISVGRPRVRSARIRIHGRGPLSDLLASSLRCSGTRVRHSNLSHAAVSADDTDLVVLSDLLVAEPRVLRGLHEAKVAHIAVRMRDGTGLIGPLVVPGVTSCLGCADLHRSDRDADWPAVAAQLRGTVGSANRAAVLATAALALDQVNRVIAAVQDGGAAREPLAILDTTLEFDVRKGSTTARRWSRHPRCDC